MKSSPGLKVLAAALLVLAVAVGGCGTTKSPTGPATSGLTQSEANDVALQTGFALDYLGFDVQGAGGSLPTSPLSARLASPLRAAWDTTITFGNLTAVVSCNFYNTHDDLLPGYGPTAVRMNWRSHIWGSRETYRDTATVQHHANLDFTGIQLTDTAIVVNGSWRSTLTGANVRIRRSDGRLLSGTLTYVASVDRLFSYQAGDVEKHWSVVVVITFDGTTQPDVVVNGTWHYKWNMDAGTMVPV
jgi:hypothetical protein